jgi:phosphonopyruvate decarboxylase
MVSCEKFSEILKRNGFNFYTGVPCSIFKEWLNFILKDKSITHVIATSEGEACGIAVGYYLSTGNFPVIYMQNSGLGNSVNPLTSLLDKEIYSIPTLLLISWRGEPGTKDAIEHVKMGRITKKILKILEIPYVNLQENEEKIEKIVKEAKNYMEKNNSPYAIIVRRGIVGGYQKKIEKDKIKQEDPYPLTIKEAIEIILKNLNPVDKTAIVSTTGHISRELFELMKEKEKNHERNFYMVGSMGCAAGIALGISMQKPREKVFIFDGDGAVLMKMGTLATIGYHKPKNLYHIIFDNESHDSTGGQPTSSKTVKFDKVALDCNYKEAIVVSKKEELEDFVKDMTTKKGPFMLVVKVRKRGARKDLGRVTIMPAENKEMFMTFLQKKNEKK